MSHVSRYPTEFREHAVRLVREHGSEYWSLREAIATVAAKVGCDTKALRSWVYQAERYAAECAYLAAHERSRLKALERENRELRRMNEVLRKAAEIFVRAAVERRSKGR